MRHLINYIILLIILMQAVALGQTTEKRVYKYNEPDLLVELPKELHEISGIHYDDDNFIYCINDELGEIYLFDIISKTIISKKIFYKKGDYEDITIANNIVYVLKSNGHILETQEFNTGKKETIKHSLKPPVTNTEGLCYDQDKNRLLISAKQSFIKHYLNSSDFRYIFSFDLNSRKLEDEPAFVFSVKEAEVMTTELYNIINLNLRPSAIAIHPISKELYILSADDYMLFIYSDSGILLKTEKLKPTIYNKAEGISFDKNGNMWISNEGKNKKPTLVFLKYKQN